MIKYKDYAPTGFDAKGLAGERNGISEFFVAPVIKTRDADCLERANFDAFLKALGGESKSVQLHSFNHWACGYFDIILISPRAKAKLKIAEAIEAELANYPIVDEELFSRYESEEQWENLTGYGGKEITEAIEDYLGIEELELSEDCLSYLCHDEFIEFPSENWPKLDPEKKWCNKKLTVEYLIQHQCPFVFPEDFDFHSDENPDLLNASLVRALATS